MFKTYYAPEPEELHKGFRYERRPLMIPSKTRGDFKKEVIGEDGNYGYMMLEIERKGVIRVQHLHREDFNELGLSCERVPTSLGNNGEGYICEGKIKHPRFANCKLRIYYTPLTKWSLITVNEATMFAGTTRNINELQRILKQIQADEIIKE